MEGPSDQFYFNAIKLFLISKNIIAPKEEIVFIPSGGVKAVGSLASLLSAKDELPVVILDSDHCGVSFKDKLVRKLYAHETDKIISVGDYVMLTNAEVEDLFPIQLFQRPIDRLFQNTDLDFLSTYDSTLPIIPQIEMFAANNKIELIQGYKVDIARQVKQSIFAREDEHYAQKVEIWKFEKILESS